MQLSLFFFFFFNDTATTEIYTLSLHDALPIWRELGQPRGQRGVGLGALGGHGREPAAAVQHFLQGRANGLGRRRFRNEARGTELLRDRKSTRLNSSHSQISYAVFCLKKKKKPEKCG